MDNPKLAPSRSLFSEKGKYKRSFLLPDNVDVDEITADLEYGILTITIPKVIDESKQKKNIVIK